MISRSKANLLAMWNRDLCGYMWYHVVFKIDLTWMEKRPRCFKDCKTRRRPMVRVGHSKMVHPWYLGISTAFSLLRPFNFPTWFFKRNEKNISWNFDYPCWITWCCYCYHSNVKALGKANHFQILLHTTTVLQTQFLLKSPYLQPSETHYYMNIMF